MGVFRKASGHRLCVLIPFLLAVIGRADSWMWGPQSAQDSPDDGILQEILRQTADYCEQVKSMAFFYVCKESVSDKEYVFRGVRPTGSVRLVKERKAFNIARVDTNHYLYDYQLIKRGDRIEEKRILLEENGEARHEENAELRNLKYISNYLIFGPVGFLSRSWQDHFEYRITGRESLNGRMAYVVHAVPTEEREDNHNIGTIWIDPKDFRILRIKWEPASIRDYQSRRIQTGSGNYDQTVDWTVDYGIEKNGVLFPSRQSIRELYIGGPNLRAVKRETIFLYRDYKFFTVEVETEIKKNPASRTALSPRTAPAGSALFPARRRTTGCRR